MCPHDSSDPSSNTHGDDLAPAWPPCPASHAALSGDSDPVSAALAAPNPSQENAANLRVPDPGKIDSVLVPQLGNGISRSREFAYTSQTLDREAKEVTNARDGGKGQGQ
jgi:hypothetical protein